MPYNLNLTSEQWAGSVPFIDSARQRFIRGGLTIDAAQVNANRVASQGQAVIRNNKLTLLAGSFISENPGTGLFEVYCPLIAAVAASLTIGAGNSAVTITANATGPAGNNIQVVFIDPGAATQALAVRYIDGIIIVDLATDAQSDISSTAAAVVAAINGLPAAAAVVTAAAGGTGLGVVEDAAMAPLAGGADGNLGVAASLQTGIPDLETTINWRALTPGVGGNAVTITYAAPAAVNQALSVTEVGNVITVNLATDAGSNLISTAAEVVAAVAAAIARVQNPVTLASASLACAIGSGVVSAMAATNLAGGVAAGAANITGRYTCILFEDAVLQDEQGNLANAVANGIDQGRVIAARLPLAPDAAARTALPGVMFR